MAFTFDKSVSIKFHCEDIKKIEKGIFTTVIFCIFDIQISSEF